MKQNNVEAYTTYMALKLHFTTDAYDYIKNEGRVKIGNKPKGIERLTNFVERFNKREIVGYMVAHFTNGDKHGGIFIDDGEDVYIKWKARLQNLTYNFTKDINTIKDYCDKKGITFLESLDSKNQHPAIMKLYLGKHINLETVVIINIIYSFVENNLCLKEDRIWCGFSRLVTKYQPFLLINRDKYETLLRRII